MKKTLFVLTSSILISISSIGQNLFFFLADSYPSSVTVELKSNANAENVNIFFTKDAVAYSGSEAKYLVMSVKTNEKAQIEGEINVYLDNGDVLILEPKYQDYMDNTSFSMYSLDDDELAQLKSSSINTIQYTIVSNNIKEDEDAIVIEEKFSASINGFATQTLIAKFFGKSTEMIESINK